MEENLRDVYYDLAFEENQEERRRLIDRERYGIIDLQVSYRRLTGEWYEPCFIFVREYYER